MHSLTKQEQDKPQNREKRSDKDQNGKQWNGDLETKGLDEAEIWFFEKISKVGQTLSSSNQKREDLI